MRHRGQAVLFVLVAQLVLAACGPATPVPNHEVPSPQAATSASSRPATVSLVEAPPSLMVDGDLSEWGPSGEVHRDAPLHVAIAIGPADILVRLPRRPFGVGICRRRDTV